jgi:uncharacterized protein YkuJ
MEPSSLRPIILRLEAMIQDTTDKVQVRRFEVDGEERVRVKYDQERDIFTLNDHSVDVKAQEFDNIDFVAMEIFELIQPVLPEEK